MGGRAQAEGISPARGGAHAGGLAFTRPSEDPLRRAVPRANPSTMKPLPLTLSLLLTACSALPSATAPQGFPVGDRKLTLMYGQREMEDGDYEPVEDQTAVGVAFSWQPTGGGLGGEFGAYRSEEDDNVGSTDVDGKTSELFAGLHHEWGQDALRPFVGAGVSWVKSEVDLGSSSDSDSGAGLYVHAGLDAWISEQVAIGVEYRMLLGTSVDLFDEETDADYHQVAFTLGFSF